MRRSGTGSTEKWPLASFFIFFENNLGQIYFLVVFNNREVKKLIENYLEIFNAKRKELFMSRPVRNLVDYQYYHVTTRGNKKNIVFVDNKDFSTFLEILKRTKQMHKSIRLYAYCLMPNHVHLLINSLKATEIPRFMKRINLCYSIFFNKKYSYVGHVWQKRYQPKPILHHQYLQNCVNYIESNPVRANICKNIADYQWSSYKEHFVSDSPRLLDDFTD
jgi:REP element-mobilizing transposase RayT